MEVLDREDGRAGGRKEGSSFHVGLIGPLSRCSGSFGVDCKRGDG